MKVIGILQNPWACKDVEEHSYGVHEDTKANMGAVGGIRCPQIGKVLKTRTGIISIQFTDTT